jgi:hypothetical protein
LGALASSGGDKRASSGSSSPSLSSSQSYGVGGFGSSSSISPSASFFSNNFSFCRFDNMGAYTEGFPFSLRDDGLELNDEAIINASKVDGGLFSYPHYSAYVAKLTTTSPSQKSGIDLSSSQKTSSVGLTVVRGGGGGGGGREKDNKEKGGELEGSAGNDDDTSFSIPPYLSLSLHSSPALSTFSKASAINAQYSSRSSFTQGILFCHSLLNPFALSPGISPIRVANALASSNASAVGSGGGNVSGGLSNVVSPYSLASPFATVGLLKEKKNKYTNKQKKGRKEKRIKTILKLYYYLS